MARKRAREARRHEREAQRHEREVEREARRSARRARRRGRYVHERHATADDPPYSYEPADEIDYEEARDLARAKARVSREVIQYAVVVGLLWFFLKPVAWIVGLVWGLELVGRFSKRVVEPHLRHRWVDREVNRRLRRTVPAERDKLENEHDRRVSELAAGVAHEIRNPISAAKSLVQQMGEDPAAEDNVGYAHVALDELNRVERSISHLLRYAREEDVHFGEMRIAAVIDSALETLRDRIARSGAQITTSVDAEGVMRGDAEQLRRVILNLLGNALDALDEAGVAEPRVDLQAGENLAGTEVWVRIRDNGPGMEPSRLQHIFSPFYTSKDDGTGLGLAISRKVVDAHGGSIEAASEPGKGTEFVITLPRAGTAANGREEEA